MLFRPVAMLDISLKTPIPATKKRRCDNLAAAFFLGFSS
jgi:hypothetical protein